MSRKWKSTEFKGVRYREHPNRKHGIMPDKYFAIRYQKDGRRKEEGLGWASEKWTAQKAAIELAKLKEAAAKGEGHTSLSDKRKAKAKQQQKAHEEEARKRREAIAFADFFTNTYFPNARHEKSPRSYKREESLFRLWISPVIGNKPFKDISADIDLTLIKRNMARAGRAPRSIHYMLAVVRQIFNYAGRLGVFNGENPVKKMRKPKYDNKRLRFLSHEEADQLLDALYLKSPQVCEMSLLSLHSGMRAGEIFSLTWGDVDLDHDLINLRDTKSGASRTLHMTNQVRNILAVKNRGKHGELVFPGRGGVQISAISKTFDYTVKALGFNDGVTDRRQKATFHTLRHTHASWLVMEGIDLYTVQKIMGHSTLAMTQRYAHLTPDKFKRATEIFQKRIEKPKIKSKVANLALI